MPRAAGITRSALGVRVGAVLLAAWCSLAAPRATAAELLALDAIPAPLAENIAIGGVVGKIRFLGMLVIPAITIDGLRLSQLSDIAWDENAGVLHAISDKGILFRLHPIVRDDVLVDVKLSRAVPLRDLKTGKPLEDRHADAEGLDILPNPSGRAADTELIVSFERYPRIVRYHTDGYAIGELALPPVLAKIESYDSRNHMLEATCHHPQFGVLTIAEHPLEGETPGFNRLFMLSGKSWRYPVEDGNRVVGLSCLANGDVLVLEGTFGSRFWRSHTTLKRVRLANAPANEPLRPESLVTLEPSKGYQIDNFEGIAHHRGARFFLVSDDNDFFLQRTLLLYIELID
ncbi:MAG TPA: esterase-like activity of phytase family protein [Burkholderiales bacterium]|jgi:hypothetical protein